MIYPSYTTFNNYEPSIFSDEIPTSPVSFRKKPPLVVGQGFPLRRDDLAISDDDG